MNVIKRDGSEVVFDESKIVKAILGVNNDLPNDDDKVMQVSAEMIASEITSRCKELNRSLNVEEIQDMVERALGEGGFHEAAKQYIIYRYKRSIKRQKNTTDDKILALIDCKNEELIQENSNKNPLRIAVQRDYMAGEVSKDLCRRYLYPQDVIAAHDRGAIHIHDTDYVLGHEHNCELINLEDMLQNGTVINGSMIEKPKSFLTACTIATQISASVASNTFGGQTISLAHLAPFIDVSRQKYRAQIKEELGDIVVSEDKLNEMAELRTRREIKAGVQTIQYQISTIMCSNGQAPFISVFMYLAEAANEREKKDLALLIEEVLKQRIMGMKNEIGVEVTPAFPKLLYCISTENCSEETPYWYLTELAAKCTAKRLVPDYISEKKMLEYKIDGKGRGNVYPCMG